MALSNKKKIFNDPIYGFVSIPDELHFDIIEHPYFQRLRRIKQVSMTNLVYPGANHTRFAHSLGAMHLMRRAVQLLRGKGYFNIAGSDYRFDFQSVRTNFHAKTEEEWNPDEERESVVVFIGAELPDKEQLEAGLLACAASETERKTA